MRIGITLGDPAGIGPEVVYAALDSKRAPIDADYKIVGNYPKCTVGQPTLETARAAAVALVTTHIPLREVAALLKQSEIVRVGLLLRSFLNTRSLETVRIAVAGLNPHAGESGKIGREEIEIIAPA